MKETGVLVIRARSKKEVFWAKEKKEPWQRGKGQQDMSSQVSNRSTNSERGSTEARGCKGQSNAGKP